MEIEQIVKSTNDFTPKVLGDTIYSTIPFIQVLSKNQIYIQTGGGSTTTTALQFENLLNYIIAFTKRINSEKFPQYIIETILQDCINRQYIDGESYQIFGTNLIAIWLSLAYVRWVDYGYDECVKAMIDFWGKSIEEKEIFVPEVESDNVYNCTRKINILVYLEECANKQRSLMPLNKIQMTEMSTVRRNQKTVVELLRKSVHFPYDVTKAEKAKVFAYITGWSPEKIQGLLSTPEDQLIPQMYEEDVKALNEYLSSINMGVTLKTM